MFNKHPQGGNVGKPQDPHRLPQLTPHISKVCLPHGGEPRHIRISSNFPSACNDLIRQKLRVYRRNGRSLGLGKPQKSISSKSYWKKNVMENLTTFPMCAWKLEMNNLPVENPPFLGPLLACFFPTSLGTVWNFLKHAYWIHCYTKNLGQVISIMIYQIYRENQTNWSTFQQHFIQSPKIKSPNPSTLSFPHALCQPSSVVSANAGSPRSGNCLGVSLERVVVWARNPNPFMLLVLSVPGWTNVNQQHNSVSTSSRKHLQQTYSHHLKHDSQPSKNLNFHKKKIEKTCQKKWFNKNQQS